MKVYIIIFQLPPKDLVERLTTENIDDFDPREISVLSSVLISAQDGVIGQMNVSMRILKYIKTKSH